MSQGFASFYCYCPHGYSGHICDIYTGNGKIFLILYFQNLNAILYFLFTLASSKASILSVFQALVLHIPVPMVDLATWTCMDTLNAPKVSYLASLRVQNTHY